MQHYPPIQAPTKPVRFRRPLVFCGLALLLGVVAYALMEGEDARTTAVVEATGTGLKPPLAGAVAQMPQSYRDLPAEEPPAPPAPPPPTDDPKAPAPPPKEPPKPAPATGPQSQAQARVEKPKRWLIASAKVEKPPVERPRSPARKDEEEKLLKPAKWVTPDHPERVLYPDQVIPAILLQALNSDAPGTLRLMVTQNVVDVQTGNTVLIPQFSRITGAWTDRPKYGDNRAQIKVQFLRLHGSGTLVDLTGGTVGGRDGASGIEADVNNHWPQVILGAGISALLAIGARAPFGDVEGFYPSLAQDYAQNVGSSLNKTGQKVVERELMRPPTLTQAAGYPVTVQLAEPVSFQQPARRSNR